jgi:hypothetical protein
MVSRFGIYLVNHCDRLRLAYEPPWGLSEPIYSELRSHREVV